MAPQPRLEKQQEPAQPPASLTARTPESQKQIQRLQQLLEKAEAMPNPSARALLQECLQSLLAMYGEGLARMLQILQHSESPALGPVIRDPAIRGLLLIHGLHPLSLETRLHEALDKVRPYMQSHGGDVQLLGLANGFARLRLQGACKTCPASSVTLELAVRQAVEEACPDLTGFEVESASGEP